MKLLKFNFFCSAKKWKFYIVQCPHLFKDISSGLLNFLLFVHLISSLCIIKMKATLSIHTIFDWEVISAYTSEIMLLKKCHSDLLQVIDTVATGSGFLASTTLQVALLWTLMRVLKAYKSFFYASIGTAFNIFLHVLFI